MKPKQIITKNINNKEFKFISTPFIEKKAVYDIQDFIKNVEKLNLKKIEK